MLGKWASDEAVIENLRQSFLHAQPYPHVVIDGFFDEKEAANIEAWFPTPQGSLASTWVSHGWHVYDNPIEGKLAKNDVAACPQGHAGMWMTLQSKRMVDLVRRITDIPNLETDPHLHGAGLHYHPPGSRLEMHLDYSIHPISGKERRVNLIVYLNRDWEEAWGGHLQLWAASPDDGAMTECVSRVTPSFNRAVLLQTSDLSWHGLPDPVTCPEDHARKSVAIYYVAEPREGATPRLKASFRPRPREDTAAGYLELCKIRDSRLLTKQDIAAHMPEWRPRWSTE